MAPSKALLGYMSRSLSASISTYNCTPNTARRLCIPCRRSDMRPRSTLGTNKARFGQRDATTARCRYYSTAQLEAPDYLNEKELHIFQKIKSNLDPVKLEVQDISGGCGSMYALSIESSKFAGLSVIKQHKLVNEILKEEIQGWHGVQLRTKAA